MVPNVYFIEARLFWLCCLPNMNVLEDKLFLFVLYIVLEEACDWVSYWQFFTNMVTRIGHNMTKPTDYQT